MIKTCKVQIDNSSQSLGTALNSSERFTRVHIRVNTGNIYLVDEANDGTENGINLGTGQVYFFEFACSDDPANNLFLSNPNGSGNVSILAY
jgi:hypothetical protein